MLRPFDFEQPTWYVQVMKTIPQGPAFVNQNGRVFSSMDETGWREI
jgi:hypothetical protein